MSEMASRTPAKRQKPEDKLDMSATQDEPPSSGEAPAPRGFLWPKDAVPVEIFHLIASYLPRRAIQNMRLVNHEFDNKLSGYYFRNVVAIFHPEMYGYLDDDLDNIIGLAQDPSRRDRSVIKNGLRVFSDFGPNIKAFALSLELDEAELACPPVKLSQEVLKAPWGLYRWPLENYARYADLENLEEVADETQRMTQAFGKLVELKEFGLCCDAGLGFLTASNSNQRLTRVFQSSRYEPGTVADRNANVTAGSSGQSPRYNNLKRMVINAGYSEAEVHDAIKLLLECEGRSSKWAADPPNIDEGEGSDQETGEQSQSQVPHLPHISIFRHLPDNAINIITAHLERQGPEPAPKKVLEPRRLTIAQKEMLLEMKWAHDALVQSYVISVIDNHSIFSTVTVFSVAKIPSSLVHVLARWDFWNKLVALRDLRLGIIPDWRCLTKSNDTLIEDTMVSPLLACAPVFDLLNTYIGKMENIKSLHFEWICGGETGPGLGQRNRYVLPAPFTAIPGMMIDVTDRPLMLSLPTIEKLSLKNCWFSPHIFLRSIRRMIESSLTYLELESISLTGPPTRQDQELIIPPNNEIAPWPWPLCSGATPGRMFTRRGPQLHQAAFIPWPGQAAVAQAQAGPNQQNWLMIANQFAQQPQLNLHPVWGLNIATAGPLPIVPPQPNPVAAFPAAAHLANINALNLVAANNVAAVPAPAPPAPSWQGPVSGTIPQPRLLSWAHILNELTPNQTIQTKYGATLNDADHGDFLELGQDRERWAGTYKKQKELATLNFKSCGYALVDDINIENNLIMPEGPIMVQMASDIIAKLRGLDKTHLIAYDALLAKIVDYVEEGEKNILHYVFDLTFPGLNNHFDSACVERGMYLDGFTRHGTGRFSGELRRLPNASPN